MHASRHAPQLTSARSRYSCRVFRAALCWLVSSFAWTWAKISAETTCGTGTSIQSCSGRGAWLSPLPAGSSADLRRLAGAGWVRLVSARPA